jgi:hypothetical protein
MAPVAPRGYTASLSGCLGLSQFRGETVFTPFRLQSRDNLFFHYRVAGSLPIAISTLIMRKLLQLLLSSFMENSADVTLSSHLQQAFTPRLSVFV